MADGCDVEGSTTRASFYFRVAPCVFYDASDQRRCEVKSLTTTALFKAINYRKQQELKSFDGRLMRWQVVACCEGQKRRL
jgi:hypothetical protein